MTELHLTYDQQQRVESHAPYLKVFGALIVFTVLEYLYARVSKDHFGLLVAGLMVMAVAKASLVAWYFMHLKFEGRWVFLMLVPATFLATVLVAALYPDIGIYEADEETPRAEGGAYTTVVPGPGRAS